MLAGPVLAAAVRRTTVSALESTAFANAESRAALVERTLAERPAAEPLHLTLRRASHAVVEQDSRFRDAVADRLQLLAREPKLTAYAARLQADSVERLAAALGDQMGVELACDLRPRLVISAVLGALNAVWAAWAVDNSTDLRDLVDFAHGTLDGGFEQALAPPQR